MNTEEIKDRFRTLTRNNDHTEAAILLAKHFGTDYEVSTLKFIQRRQEAWGFIIQEDREIRDQISNKYFYRHNIGKL